MTTHGIEYTAQGKASTRRAAYARRRAVTPDERRQAGLALAPHATALYAPLNPGSTVAAYPSMGTEIETRPLLTALLAARLRLIVPVLGAGRDVGWGELPALDALRDVPALHAAGQTIRMDRPTHPAAGHMTRRPQEPQGPVLGLDALRQASLIIVPALMVDRDGTRLGRGGGWYDRALRCRAAGAPVVAVCWPWEVRDDPLPREPHDLPVDAALTPRGLTWFSRGNAQPSCLDGD